MKMVPWREFPTRHWYDRGFRFVVRTHYYVHSKHRSMETALERMRRKKGTLSRRAFYIQRIR